MKKGTIIALALCLLSTLALAQNANKMEKKVIKQTAGRTQLGEFAPKFAELNDDVLFGQVWSRTDKLSLHDRSMVTVTALISSGITDSSLKYHLQSAKANGVSRTEIAEVITQIGFYAGWPKAWAAFNLAKQVWTPETKAADDKAAFEQSMLFPLGEPNTAYAKYFIGQSYLAPLSTSQAGIHNVTFEPGCRNNWHIHHAQKRRRPNPGLRGWRRLVSGMGKTGTEAPPRRCGQHCCRREALARSHSQQLVCTPGNRSARHRHKQ